MMKKIVCVTLLMAMAGSLWAGGPGSGRHKSESSSSRLSKGDGTKSVYVQSYTKKNGTVVHSYYRSRPHRK